jgi:transposase
MEVLYPRCAGLDVHAGSVTACARIAIGATVTYEHRTVSTTTRGLLELAEWLTAHACTHVAILTRTRRQLVHEVPRHVLRIQKTLEDANLKLTQVMSDIVGVSGRAILNALIAGETDPDRLADLTRGRLQATRADLLDALHGRITDHHRFMMKLHLTQIDGLETAIATIEARIGNALGPFRAAVSLLTTMPGLSETTARVLIAEIGTDMSRFPSVGHLISWAGFCPRLDESAGKRRSTRTRQATPGLKPTLINGAWAETGTNPRFAEFARASDILVMHLTIGAGESSPLHASPDVVGRVARAANARRLILSHIGQFDLEAAVAQVKKEYAGPVIVGSDLQCVSGR